MVALWHTVRVEYDGQLSGVDTTTYQGGHTAMTPVRVEYEHQKPSVESESVILGEQV